MNKELYCGVDLHSNNGVYQIVRTDGIPVWRRRLGNCPQIVLRTLEPFRERLISVAIESTYNWYWLADCLQRAGYTVELANPSAMEQYNGLKNSNDNSDAAFIAELMRLRILPKGWICPPEDRAWRDLLRRRMQMVNARTRLILSLQSMVTRQTGQSFKTADLEKVSIDGLDGLLEHTALCSIAHEQLRLLGAHNESIASLEQLALERCKPRPEYRLLTTVPGIGMILAMVIMMEVGDITRFRSPGKFSSYCRSVPARRSSNGKSKGKNNARNGNKYLGWAFIEAANHAIRCCAPARKWYQRKTASAPPVVGRKALAAKWSKAVWYMLTEKKPFQLKHVFG